MALIDREKLRDRLYDILGSGPSSVVDPDVRTEKQEDCGSHVRRLVSYWWSMSSSVFKSQAATPVMRRHSPKTAVANTDIEGVNCKFLPVAPALRVVADVRYA